MRGRRVLLVVLAGVALLSCGDDDDAVSDPGASADAVAVTIEGSRFDPAEVTVAVDTEVRWENLDAIAHTVTSDDGSFVSTELAEGSTFAQTFRQPGTYEYHCEIHPSMQATVVVE